ncbi:ubiquinol-cytochrome c reductase iron-sulfur subunit [Arenicella chitinivorans]|uniref:Ubiquinol-cytochrome c reductase iron-sulfur subunit n=2 Tax=Arenicella chitinivorans TaxID=1329800 RepID=A0A918RVH9_9GAMM|nr:ubiquinol-cytochrome c reductase iron-sulfur subunit [Arenicella chitinivorans]GHA10846.1 ubiquinol-cytochrome c reductase iron-sulfur subunit [Arenicella chitinivorans]
MADNQVSSANAEGMSVEDKKRRRFLTGITAGFGAVGGAFAVTPFVLSMTPSERAKNAGAPVQHDLSKIQSGQMVKVEWRGKPVVLLKRSDEMMAGLDKVVDKLADPDSLSSSQPVYAQNNSRSDQSSPALLVMEAVCTHLGCSPVEKLAIGPDPQMGPDSQGGFFCPCHGSKFDLAGRVYKNVPATTNMSVPPFAIADDIITIGEDGGRNA